MDKCPPDTVTQKIKGVEMLFYSIKQVGYYTVICIRSGEKWSFQRYNTIQPVPCQWINIHKNLLESCQIHEKGIFVKRK